MGKFSSEPSPWTLQGESHVTGGFLTEPFRASLRCCGTESGELVEDASSCTRASSCRCQFAIL